MSTEYMEYKESPHPQPLPFEGRGAAADFLSSDAPSPSPKGRGWEGAFLLKGDGFGEHGRGLSSSLLHFFFGCFWNLYMMCRRPYRGRTLV